MNKILLIGNGFDLAHGLPTNYKQFLFVLQNWNDFYVAAKRYGRLSDQSPFYPYFKGVTDLDMDNLSKLDRIVRDNSWVDYFCKCEAEIDGWIDFEKEIYPVIDLFGFIFNTDYEMSGHGGSLGDAVIEKDKFESKKKRIALLWEKYLKVEQHCIRVIEPYASMKYGILKKTILESLRKEFDDFIKAFEIYLLEFVHKKDGLQLFKQIKDINADYVVSFNYTLTEELYGINKENVHHIHGMIREDINTEKNNMVLGVNESENQNMDFIYFVKYFQRIRKASGVKYKAFVNEFFYNKLGEEEKELYELYIYGHSLDETDEDILKYVIGEKKDNQLLNAVQVIIYYYDSADYEQKVINLIKLYGRPMVEEYMERELFKFVETTGEIYTE